MASPLGGASFRPAAVRPAGGSARPASPVQRAVQVLSLRLPQSGVGSGGSAPAVPGGGAASGAPQMNAVLAALLQQAAAGGSARPPTAPVQMAPSAPSRPRPMAAPPPGARPMLPSAGARPMPQPGVDPFRQGLSRLAQRQQALGGMRPQAGPSFQGPQFPQSSMGVGRPQFSPLQVGAGRLPTRPSGPASLGRAPVVDPLVALRALFQQR